MWQYSRTNVENRRDIKLPSKVHRVVRFLLSTFNAELETHFSVLIISLLLCYSFCNGTGDPNNRVMLAL